MTTPTLPTPTLSSPSIPSPSTPSDPLAGLRDIHMPEAIGWWPLAPGWWLLLGLVVVLGVALWWWLRWRETQRNKPIIFSHADIVKAALLELNALDQHPDSSASIRHLIIETSHILRRSAMQLDASGSVAGLTGEAWLKWLDSRWDRHDFTQTVGQTLIDAPYRNTALKTDDLDALLLTCRAWLEQQR